MQSTCCILKDADQSTGKSALVDLEFQNSKVPTDYHGQKQQQKIVNVG